MTYRKNLPDFFLLLTKLLTKSGGFYAPEPKSIPLQKN